MTDTTIRKNTKATITSPKKKFSGGLSVCLHVRFKHEVKIEIEIRKIERGIAETMPFTIFTILTCFQYRTVLWL